MALPRQRKAVVCEAPVAVINTSLRTGFLAVIEHYADSSMSPEQQAADIRHRDNQTVDSLQAYMEQKNITLQAAPNTLQTP
jgi:hypothetical protein